MKQTLLSFLLALLPIVASAVKVGGIYYNLSSDGNTAEVTTNPYKYSEDVVIPESVTYAGIEYSVTSIGESAFYGCSGLTSVTIPNSVTSIGIYAFFGCSSLTSVTIPNSVTSIGKSAFMNCSGLTSVTIPTSVTSIEIAAFYGCSGLTSVTIPNSVNTIGIGAFQNCSGLATISIGSGVTSILEKAFASCPALSDVYCYAEYISDSSTDASYYGLLFTWNDAFEYSNIYHATLHVPESAIWKYRSIGPWKSFGKIVEMDSSTLNISGVTEGKPISVYDVTGKLVGTVKSSTESTTNTKLRSGKIGVVKIGEKTMKVIMR